MGPGHFLPGNNHKVKVDLPGLDKPLGKEHEVLFLFSPGIIISTITLQALVMLYLTGELVIHTI